MSEEKKTEETKKNRRITITVESDGDECQVNPSCCKPGADAKVVTVCCCPTGAKQPE